jgi:LacI family transcriptional regulator
LGIERKSSMTKSKTRATVHDVARAAGVAVGSVSRALNNLPDVTPDIRERILAAAKSLDYTRLRKRSVRVTAAMRLVTGAPNVGLICFGMDDTLVELPVVSAAMHGIESAISEQGGSLMFASIPKGDRVPAFLAENRIAGVIVKGPNQGELPDVEESELLRQIYRIPHVWMMGSPPNAVGDHCNFDADAVGRIAADHLKAKGHVHVAFLNPKPGHAQFEVVKRGFCECSRAHGSKVDVLEPEQSSQLVWPLPATTSQQKVDALVQRWFALPKPRRATAMAVGADTTAVQIYSAMSRLGLRVGRDVGLVSCNDERSLVMGLNPPLTTIDVRPDTIGRNAVARLLWRAANRSDNVPVKILIQPVLAERESVQTMA